MAGKIIPFEKPEKKLTERQKASQYRIDKDKWMEYLCTHPDLGKAHAVYRVGSFLAWKMNAKTQTAWWSVEKIAKSIDCDPSTVTASTKFLVKLGLLAVARNRGGRNNIYSLIFPWREPEE